MNRLTAEQLTRIATLAEEGEFLGAPVLALLTEVRELRRERDEIARTLRAVCVVIEDRFPDTAQAARECLAAIYTTERVEP